ncbi:MAG TPA: sensor domain-containing diguanylate cyclase [Longimicrobiales bacterium]
MTLSEIPVAPQQRLMILLEIGRSLSHATDMVELRTSVIARLSSLFEADRLFYADVDASWMARLVAVASHGHSQRADATYRAISTEATSDDGCALHAEAARSLAQTVDDRSEATDALIVPVRVGDRVVGEVGALRRAARPYTSEDADVLAFGAAIIAAALSQRARMEESEARRVEAERLEEIGRAISSSLEVAEVLERVMQAAIDLIGADAVTIWRREGERSMVVASHGDAALPVGFQIDVAPAVQHELIASRRSIPLDDITSDPRLPAELRARVSSMGPRSAILIPMVMHDDVVGVLSVGHHEPHRYGADAIRILERLALQAAIAVENAELHAEIRELSLTDPLTGLPNRRHFETVLANEFEAARRGRRLSVVLLDLDDFKGFNDRHGHAGGDQALREFAEILALETRAMNLAVRYGGDEFVTIMSEPEPDSATLLIQRVRDRVAAHPRLREIGFSAGVADYDPAMQTPHDLIEAADAAMYRRKTDTRLNP